MFRETVRMNEYILNNLHEGIIIFDEKNNLRFCNESVLHKLGYTSDELAGEGIGKIIFSESNEEINISILEGEKQVELYVRTIHEKKINIIWKMLKEEWKGEVAYWIIITEYKEKPYTVEELEYILENLPFPIWISDEKGRYKYANSNVLQTLRREFDIKSVGIEVINKHEIDVWGGNIHNKVMESDYEILTTGRVISEDRSIEQEDRKVGYHITKIPIINKESIFKGYVGIIEDNIFQENFEHIIFKAIGANVDSDIMNANKIGKQIKNLLVLENKTAQLVGVDTLFICKYEQYKNKIKCICQIGEKQPEVLQSIEMQMNYGTYNTFKQRREWHLDELEKYIQGKYCEKLKALGMTYLRIIPIESGSEDMGLMIIVYRKQPHHSVMEIKTCQNLCKHIGILLKNNELSQERNRELARRQEAEEERLAYKKALELESVKNEFMANMSHELKTPLNIIYGMLQLVELEIRKGLKETPDSIVLNKLERYRQVSKQNVFRLLRLINNITEVSYTDAGYYRVKLVNCDVVRIIEDITMSVVYYVKNKKLNIIFDTEVEELVMACDPEKIERIMLNLLANAVKYTNEGGDIQVNIEIREGHLVVLVKDNGIGIPKDKQASIFERFVQVDPSFTRKCEGSGIGLALVKRLVELHKGLVRVESELGKGSTFIIEIPIEEVEEKLEVDINIGNTLVEKCKIEFSDIYDL